MGLPIFRTQAEGVIPVLVMNTIFSVVLIKNMVKSMIQNVGSSGYLVNFEEDRSVEDHPRMIENPRLSITKFKSLSGERRACICSCSVCLCGYEDDEEVSELSCEHFFHKGCLEKWFENRHRTCPLCRSMV